VVKQPQNAGKGRNARKWEECVMDERMFPLEVNILESAREDASATRRLPSIHLSVSLLEK
jgi:hypothetical protein